MKKKLTKEQARLMSAARVAEFLDISPRQVYFLAEAKILPPPIRLGGSRKWDRIAIEGCLDDLGALSKSQERACDKDNC
jgi:predicted DNA-binding transcriptional regulator AlpA